MLKHLIPSRLRTRSVPVALIVSAWSQRAPLRPKRCMHICEWRLQWAVVRAHTGQQLVLALAVSLDIFGWRSANHVARRGFKFDSLLVSAVNPGFFALCATTNGRGSVLRGSGWSVPCVSIQLTLSQQTVCQAEARARA